MLKATSNLLKKMGFTSPGLLVDEDQVRTNIRLMAEKARRAGARFRPHFKTHQSADVGRWFADEGVRAITVSSLSMAEYFAANGWHDITIAFLLNPLEGPRLMALGQDIAGRGGQLAVTVDSVAAARWVADHGADLGVWLKIDAGYGRTGVQWQDIKTLQNIATILVPTGRWQGLLTHSGNSYSAEGEAELKAIWQDSFQRLESVRKSSGFPDSLEISLGDTPCCRGLADLSGPDEIRPGNFVFYDLMQWSRGICEAQELAAGVVCPVVGLYPERNTLVFHGGAVHLSREFILGSDGGPRYGCLGIWQPQRQVLKQAPVLALSQEHGTVRVSAEDYAALFGNLEWGDLVLVWPVHSCLSCDLAWEFRTPEGITLKK